MVKRRIRVVRPGEVSSRKEYQSMSSYKTVMTIAISLSLVVMTVFAEQLTNDDVVKLAAAGLDDSVLIAKIEQAEEVEFSLETDDLISLSEAGVSGDVIAAMLARTTRPPVAQQTPAAQPDDVPEIQQHGVTMLASDGRFELLDLTSTGMSGGMFVHFTDYPGLHAEIRTRDKKPAFLVRLDRPPQNRIYIVKVDVDEDDDVRSLKIGGKGVKKFFKAQVGQFTADSRPDKDWTFTFTSEEIEDGVWKLTLEEELQPGEYGVLAGSFFDFGVDP
jgi:hypothetical protein